MYNTIQTMDKTTSRMILGLLATSCVVVTVFAWLKARAEAEPEAAKTSIYDADEPVSAPVPVDHRLVLFTPIELAKAPLADVFTPPMGAENGAFTYVAQGYGDVNAARGGKHSGLDINGIGGENTDKGMPVRSVACGLLVYAGEPSPEWGNVVVLLHRLPDGRFIQSLYAHLDFVEEYPAGSIIGRGERIGSVGTAHGNYLAHLHFEMIESIAHEAGMPAYGKTLFNRINPEEIFNKYAPDPLNLIPDPIIALKKVQTDANWEKLMENILKDNDMKAVEKLLPGDEAQKSPQP